MTENLDQLRQVAERATQTDWHPVLVGFPGREVWLVDSELSFICSTQVGDERGERDSLHIATFDPTTVLALLDRIKYLEGQTRRNYQDWQIAYGRAEAAEAAVQRVRAKHSESVLYEWDEETNSPKLSDNGERVVLARLCLACSSDDAIESAGDGEWYEGVYHEVYYPCPTIRALDGGEQE